MALSWTMDKIGPMCRSVEDCALVFNAIYGPDGRDDTVVDAPFAWNPDVPLSKLRSATSRRSSSRSRPKAGAAGGGDARLAAAAAARRRSSSAHRSEARLKLLNDALDVYRKAGATLQPIELPRTTSPTRIGFILSVEAAAAFDDLTRSKDIPDPSLNTWPNTFRTTASCRRSNTSARSAHARC